MPRVTPAQSSVANPAAPASSSETTSTIHAPGAEPRPTSRELRRCRRPICQASTRSSPTATADTVNWVGEALRDSGSRTINATAPR